MSKPHILIVEDDSALRDALTTTLEIADFKVTEAEQGAMALTLMERQNFDLVVSDVNMPGMDGHELLAEIRENYPFTPVMLITAFGQIDRAVSAMQAGAVDYLVKPFETSVLVDAVKQILQPSKSTKPSQRPVAVAASSKRTLELARKVAATDSTVLISGESGTGKEVLARYIHSHSERKHKPFVAINCAAIPENMLEAILFGHEKGAFTGAYNSVPGKFEQANGGTLLLDEVSEMDFSLQAKLLRVLQEREVERVGGRKPIRLDVRVLATTNRDLRSYVDEGNFREDLYYRLSVFPVRWSALRDRREDIVPIAERLLSNHAAKMARGDMQFSLAAKQILQNHSWPGNVRELDNVIQRALIMQSGDLIEPEDCAIEQLSTSPSVAVPHSSETIAAGLDEANVAEDGAAESSLGAGVKQHEYQLIIETLRNANGKRKQAAEILGISPRTLRYKLAQMREQGINVEQRLMTAC